MGGDTRPPPLLCLLHKLGSHGIERNVTYRIEQMYFVHHHRSKALPQMTSRSQACIDLAGIAPMRIGKSLAQAVFMRVVALSAEHDRSTFASGSEPLDHYFRQRVTQDIRRRVTACLVAIAPEGRVAGYYTLASASLVLAALPPQTARRLPRYPSIPAVRLGRLAVDQAFRGQGLGSALVADALARAARSETAAFAMTVNAKDEAALAF
jgi:ribosomal protein S18 acetylase RimI-like enzyme